VHLIPCQSAISGHCNLQHASDAPQLSGVGSSSKQFQQNWWKEEPRMNYFYKAFTETSSPYLLFVTVEAWTVDRIRRPTEMHHGIFYFECTSIMPGPWPCAANKQATLSSPPTNKLCFRITKQKNNTPMWELSLSQASFHSFSRVILNCRWQGWKAWHSMVQRGKGVRGKGLLFFS